MPDTLESQSLWYLYKTRVWLAESPETAAIHNTMRVLRSIRNSGPLAYVSVPITSGKYFYDQKLQHGVISIQDVIDHNYREGWTLVNDVIARRKCSVLYPADLVPARQKWSQDHFQALWLSIIGEKCTEVHMSENWEFSNGGAEEFTHAMQLRLGIPNHKDLAFWNTKEGERAERERMRNMKVYDHLGNELTLADGRRLITHAVTWVSENTTINPDKLKNCLRLLDWTEQKIAEGFHQ